MKKAVLAMMLMAGGLFAAPRVSVGIGFGALAPVAVARPACPGPGYTWVDGYYASNGGWVAGYWAPPAVMVAPHYDHDGFGDRHLAEHHDFDRHDMHFRR